MYFAIPVDYRGKIKESEMIKTDLDLRGELKMLWNSRVTVTSVVICALAMVPTGLEEDIEELEIRKRIKNIQTTALLRSARILSRLLEI